MMRVTNSMISKKSMSNMNTNKVSVDRLNNQMSTQKKISRPSEDPVVAIRALRLRSNLNELNQYYEKNIPDAHSWLEVTEAALKNMQTILDDVYAECNNGATDTLKQEDRAAILKNLQSLRTQVYEEGNADYAGRTVFTGYKTSSQLTFTTDDPEITYDITEPISYKDIEEKRFYSNVVDVPNVLEYDPTTGDPIGVDMDDMPQEFTYSRIRLSYEGMEDLNPANLTYSYTDPITGTVRDRPLSWFSTGSLAQAEVVTDMTYDDWEEAGFPVDDDQAIFFKETGELILGKDLANAMKSEKLEMKITYTKTGFDKGEVRPEHYFNCVNTTDASNPITYTKENQEIKYTVAFNQDMTVNTQACDVLDSSIDRDIDELTNVVQAAIAAHDKIAKIESMMTETQYNNEKDQKALGEWLDAAKKEAAYADDNMQKTFGRGITKFQKYKDTITLARTDLGSREARLNLTENRVSNQQDTFEQLKTRNEDMELSDIIIEFTAAYNAYQASLQASSKANGQTLLDYI